MQWYVTWVTENLLLSAFIQFAVLGTAGEVLGAFARITSYNVCYTKLCEATVSIGKAPAGSVPTAAYTAFQ